MTTKDNHSNLSSLNGIGDSNDPYSKYLHSSSSSLNVTGDSSDPYIYNSKFLHSNLSSVNVTGDSNDPYIYNSTFLCWVAKNATYENGTTSDPNKYCYYGPGVVITLSFLLVVTMVLAIGGNIMVILTIARHRGMRTRTNLLLANLAVADILVAVLDMPIALITLINGKWIFSHLFCDFNGFTVGLGLMLSIHTLMWISLHKFYSITRPFSRSVTPGKITLMIIAAWSWTILFNLTPTPIIGLTDTEYKLGSSQCGPGVPKLPKQLAHSAINTVFNLLIPFIVMTYCYYRIFKEVKDHLNRMRDFADVSACNSLIEQRQITETLCIVLSVFVLFWMPYIVYSLSLVFLGKSRVPVIFNPIAYLFGYMNSACNPIIYALRSLSFRRGFIQIICGNTRHRYQDSIYSRKNSMGTVGKMVVSFRRPVFGTEVTGTKKMVKQHSISEKSKVQQTKEKFPEETAVDEALNNDASCGETSRHEIVIKLNQEEKNNSGSNVVVYKNIHNPTNINTCEGVAKYPESVSNDVTCSCKSKGLSDQNSCEESSDLSNRLKNKQELYLNDKKPVDIQDAYTDKSSVIKDSNNYLELGSNGQRKRSVSYTSIANKMVCNDCEASASQPNITLLPTQNLNIHANGERLSNSNREILVTRLEIQNNQIRSVSVGDVRVSCREQHVTVQDIKKELPTHLSNLKYPFVWQPSVDNLYGSPVITRRNFHLRKAVLQSKLNDRDNCQNMPRVKKSSASSVGSHKHHLGVSSLITGIKKSFTDLFHLEEDSHFNSGTEIQGSSQGRATGLSEGRAPGLSEGRTVELCEGKSAGSFVDEAASSSEGRAAGLSEGKNASLSEGRIAISDRTTEDDSEEKLADMDSVCHL